jgi:hypothetical protein
VVCTNICWWTDREKTMFPQEKVRIFIFKVKFQKLQGNNLLCNLNKRQNQSKHCIFTFTRWAVPAGHQNRTQLSMTTTSLTYLYKMSCFSRAPEPNSVVNDNNILNLPLQDELFQQGTRILPSCQWQQHL